MRKHISNLKSNIYSIHNLPEEVIAVLFAYVSRHPESFKDNLKVVTKEKAKKFHEKWVLEFGHSSVAEHAVIHLGIEKVSRLFTAELALSNKFISITEYSQRYQRLTQNDFVIPEDLKNKEAYSSYYDSLYCIYDELIKKGCPKEDARYILPLSSFSSMGITVNARALAESLSLLNNSVYSEVRSTSSKLQKEATSVCPTLIRPRKTTRTLNYNALSYLKNELRLVDRQCSKHLQNYYSFSFGISEACFHQLLRHRSFEFMYSYPIHNYSIAHSLLSKDYHSLLNKAIDIANNYNHDAHTNKEKMRNIDYSVLNCSVRKVICRVSEEGLDNFLNLRLKNTAQKEIRYLAQRIQKCLRKI